MKGLSLRKRILSWHQAHPDRASWVLLIGAFADASLLPFTIATLFVTLALIDKTRIKTFIIVTVMGTLAGAVTGYIVGHYAWITPEGEFTRVAHFFFNNIPGFSEGVYNKVHAWYLKWDLGILFFTSFTPIPYGVLSVSSGVFNLNLLFFCSVTFFSQAVKYISISFLVIKLGEGIRKIFRLSRKGT